SRDRAPVVQGYHQFAIVDIQDFNRYSEDLCSFFHLFFASKGEGSAGFLPVANVAVGDRNKFYVMSFSCPHGRNTAGLQFAIVRMCAEADDTKFAVVRRSSRARAITGGEHAEPGA